MVKIIFISSRADTGGGPLQMYDIISGIDRARFEPFAALPDEEPFYGKILALGIETLPVKKRALSPADLFRLAKFVNANGIRIVHSHGKGAGVYSRLLKFFCPHIKVIHTYHGYHYDGMPKAREWLHRSVETALARFTDRFVSVSEGESIQYAQGGLLDHKKTVMIRNFLPRESLERIEKIMNAKRPVTAAGSGKLRFIAVARFDPVKRMPFLVESFVGAARKLSLSDIVNLSLVGDGEEYQRCRDIADKLNAGALVEFLGERNDALELMAGSDVYVSASRREGLSLAMLEAVACGLPILAPRVAGIAELVRPYDRGILFESGDHDSFKRGLAAIVECWRDKWNTEPVSYHFPAIYDEHREYIKKYEKLYFETLFGRDRILKRRASSYFW